MARKVANGSNKRQSRVRKPITQDSGSENLQASSRSFRGSRGEDYSQLIRELFSNPAVKYVAGGIAVSILSRLAQNMSEKYPELSRFLKENIDSFEGRLGQFRPGFSGDEARESRI